MRYTLIHHSIFETYITIKYKDMFDDFIIASYKYEKFRSCLKLDNFQASFIQTKYN